MWSMAVAAGLVAALLAQAAPVAAAGTVTHCGNDTQLSSRLAGGGTVTFACGKKTILLNDTLDVTSDAVIDGGGKITLSGGGSLQLFHVASGVTLTLKGIVLKGGSSLGNGGAIDNEGTLHLDHVRITNSKAPTNRSGGAIFTTGPVTAKHSTFDHDSAGDGGAIMAFDPAADVTITDSTFLFDEANGSDGRGGAIVAAESAKLVVSDSHFDHDTAEGYGGAIADSYTTATIKVIRSTFDSGQSLLDGGAIYSNGTLTLEDSTFYFLGSTNGGAVWSANVLVATNDTFYSDAADLGGALYVKGAATVSNATFDGNTAGLPNATGTGGAIYKESGALTLNSSLVARSFQSDNCTFASGATTGNVSLSTDDTCHFGVGRDDVPVKLGDLDTNGGPVPTIRLLPGSAAIDDGGTSGQCTKHDVRGVLRPKGLRCDVGAFEFQPCSGKPGLTTSPAVESGAPGNVERGAFLDWVGPDCTKTYGVVVHRGSKTGPKVFTKHGLTDSSVDTTLLAPGYTYYWQASACNAHGCTSGPWWSFKPPVS